MTEGRIIYEGNVYDLASAIAVLDGMLQGIAEGASELAALAPGRGASWLLELADRRDKDVADVRTLRDVIGRCMREHFDARDRLPLLDGRLEARAELWRMEATLAIRSMRLERAIVEYAQAASRAAAQVKR